MRKAAARKGCGDGGCGKQGRLTARVAAVGERLGAARKAAAREAAASEAAVRKAEASGGRLREGGCGGEEAGCPREPKSQDQLIRI